jgi:hypothetical protein
MDRPKRNVKPPTKLMDEQPKPKPKPVPKKKTFYAKDESEEEFDDSYITDESDFDESILTDAEELSEDEGVQVCSACK